MLDIYSFFMHIGKGSAVLSLSVFYQDEYLLVCEKPVGVSSESPGLPELASSQTGYNCFPVHRLDQGTGGVCVLAFSSDICARMQNLFRQEKVKKEYYAVVAGRPDASSGLYEDFLFHDRKSNKTFVVKRQRAGVKKAVCEWTLLSTVFFENQPLSLVRVSLHTGRTHQIRIQFGSRGYPLVGDRKYGSRMKADTPSLWASSISFPHPCDSSRLIEASSSPKSAFPWNLFPEKIYGRDI